MYADSFKGAPDWLIAGVMCMQTLLKEHLLHWKEVRRQVVAEGELDMERFEHRLLALVPAGGDLIEAQTPTKMEL